MKGDRKHTRSCATALFCTAVPTHHAAILLSPASSLRNSPTSGVHSPSVCMLFALSMFSINCSRLSNATILSASATSGARIAAMLLRISSASLGPPMSTFSASAFSGRAGALAEEVDAGALAEEWAASGFGAPVFARLHLRRLLRPGSMI